MFPQPPIKNKQLTLPTLYRPFHAAIGITTTRMLLNVRKATAEDVTRTGDDSISSFRGTMFSTLPPVMYLDTRLEAELQTMATTGTGGNSDLQFQRSVVVHADDGRPRLDTLDEESGMSASTLAITNTESQSSDVVWRASQYA